MIYCRFKHIFDWFGRGKFSAQVQVIHLKTFHSLQQDDWGNAEMISQLFSIRVDSTSGFKEQIISALRILKYGQRLLQTSIVEKGQYRQMYCLNLVTFQLQIVNHLPAESTS